MAAATDPGRAAWLFGDAERIANSITHETAKASALSYVAKRWPPPTPAAPRASPTPSPTRPSKAWALSDVAGAVAATDPGRAVSASPTPSPTKSAKVSALSDVAVAVAATDPGRAERIANSITNESAKASALSGVAEAVAATDPGRAERIANSITNESVKAAALSWWRSGGSHRPRPRRTHRQLHHQRVLESIGVPKYRGGARLSLTMIKDRQSPRR